jgi:hypothetical protein
MLDDTRDSGLRVRVGPSKPGQTHSAEGLGQPLPRQYQILPLIGRPAVTLRHPELLA